MVVTDNKSGDEVTLTVKAPSDGPPPYDLSPQSTSQLPRTQASASASTTSRRTSILRRPTRPKPPNIPASNFVKINRRNTSIKGTYVIDAGLRVPDEVLLGSAAPELSTASTVDGSLAETRKNLCLECTHGSISADVWLVDDETNELDGGRTELNVKAQSGSVTIKLNSVTSRPFALDASARFGYVSVALPSDFVVPVTMSAVNGSVLLSDTMDSRLMTFSEVDGKRSCFVGDFRRALAGKVGLDRLLTLQVTIMAG